MQSNGSISYSNAECGKCRIIVRYEVTRCDGGSFREELICPNCFTEIGKSRCDGSMPRVISISEY